MWSSTLMEVASVVDGYMINDCGGEYDDDTNGSVFWDADWLVNIVS